MVLLINVVSLAAAIISDWLDGRREGPRPTRAKLAYGLLLVLIVYHTVAIEKWIKLPTYYDSANAIFGPAADTLLKWFNFKG